MSGQLQVSMLCSRDKSLLASSTYNLQSSSFATSNTLFWLPTVGIYCKRQQIQKNVFLCSVYITGQYCLFHGDSYIDIFGQWKSCSSQCYVLDSDFAGFYSYSVCRGVCRISSWVKIYYRNVRKRNCEVTKFPAYRQIHFSFCDVFQHEDCGSLILFYQAPPRVATSSRSPAPFAAFRFHGSLKNSSPLLSDYRTSNVTFHLNESFCWLMANKGWKMIRLKRFVHAFMQLSTFVTYT